MVDFRELQRRFLASCFAAPEHGLNHLGQDHIHPNARIHVSDPVGELAGPTGFIDGLILPLRRALSPSLRRDLLVIGGQNRRDVGGTWVACISHISGLFKAPLWGIRPSGKLVHIRCGEFWRIEGDGVTEGRVIIDLLDLMHQVGVWPLSAPPYGAPGLFPPPATQDGLCPTSAPEAGAASLDVVEAMLGALHVYNPETYGSDGQVGQGGTWAPDFSWYGPGGIGSTMGWQGFVDHHRAPFLAAFPDRKGGNHYCRIGDGAYAAVSGWPSMTMTHEAPYLGVPATQKKLTLRVMDFYRCETGLIAENWVLLDYVDLLRQMGVDILAAGAGT